MSTSLGPASGTASGAASSTATTTGAHLGHTSLNIDSLRDLARKELVSVLDSDHGVEKIYHLQPGPLETDCRNIIYICRPQLHYMKYIAEHIQTHTKTPQSGPYTYSLFFVPRRTALCEKVLEDEGVFGEITKGEYHLDLIPMEDDVLSLEWDSTFKELYLDHDTTSIYYAAKALMRLQGIYGLFPRILGKGDNSKALCDMMLRMRREMAVDDLDASMNMQLSQNIDSLIIIDRGVDLVTPLCTQLTYEGLIDEIFHIKNSFVEVDASLANPPSTNAPPTAVPTASSSTASTGKKKKVPLNAGDKLFGEIRDLNFSVVGGLLNKVARRINADYDERHSAKTVPQIRQFIVKMGGLAAEHQSLRLHVVAGIATNKEPEYIEEMINKQAPLVQVLRLLCLYSIVNSGLKAKQFEFFRKEILETYGFEHIQTLANLQRLGMLTKQVTNRNPYGLIRRSLSLIVDEVNEHAPNDISYVYSGYAPLSVRLVQCVVQRGRDGKQGGAGRAHGVSGLGNGWKGFEDVLRMLPGRTFDETQRVNDGQPQASKRLNVQPRVSLVFFLGGCTYTEISATRFLATQEGGQRDFVICTTQILNGNTLIDSIVQKVPDLHAQ
ncbi:hypothetical protein BGW38_010322 [Lunasporangiospora selenospora]|uniref:Vacuolar protein sorting-associated protein 33A n=1 Tax=Lunasporangiospora selenospora TaxID=979761 RepID=A0A9P6FWC6_9FUNG|nr:hypothetical protein BGW38_010322 [Lunasporangiospora selenospora]